MARTLSILETPGEALRLRGHTLLCLQGFRGLGYSPAFVENLSMIYNNLARNNQMIVQVQDTVDAVCEACPHDDIATGCTLNGPGTEVRIQTQDHVVLTRLGLQPGERVTWEEILDRIRKSVSADDLTKICGQCRWLSLGFCRSGIQQLRDHQ